MDVRTPNEAVLTGLSCFFSLEELRMLQVWSLTIYTCSTFKQFTPSASLSGPSQVPTNSRLFVDATHVLLWHK